MKTLTAVLFIIYMIILVKVVVFKGQLFYQVVPSSKGYKTKTASATFRGYNLVPFHTIKGFLTTDPSTATSVKVFNVLGNIALFMPFGFLLPYLFKEVRFRYVSVAGMLLSLSFEVYQLFTHTGEFDVDDIILNTLGAVTGYFVYTTIKKMYRPKISGI